MHKDGLNKQQGDDMIDAQYLIGEHHYPRGQALQYFVDEGLGAVTYKVIDATQLRMHGNEVLGKFIVEEGSTRLPDADPKTIGSAVRKIYETVKTKYRFPHLDLVKTTIDEEGVFAVSYAEIFVTMHHLMQETEN